MSDVVLTMTREALFKRLEDQLKLAEEHDKEVAKSHKLEEQEFLKKMRTACQKLQKLPYEDAKKVDFFPVRLIDGYSDRKYRGGIVPECPQAMAPKFQNMINNLGISSQTKYAVSANGRWRQLYKLLTWSPNPIEEGDVC